MHNVRRVRTLATIVFAVVVIVVWTLLLLDKDRCLKDRQKHWTEREWDRYAEQMETRPLR